MANSNGWGDGAANNTIGWGQGANNAIGWGDSHLKSWAGLTDIAGFDSSAISYFNSTGITGTTQQDAIDNLVRGLKDDGIWTKMKAIYPFATDNRNLLSYTEDFTNVLWASTTATITANSITAPNGTLTASLFQANAAFGRITQSNIRQTAGTFKTSIYIKGVSGVASIGSIVVNRGVGFTINTSGVVTVNNPVGYNSGSNFLSESVGNGWYRISFDFAYTTGADGIVIASSNSGDSFYIWGAQVELNSILTAYQPIATTQQAYISNQFKFNLVNPVDSDAAFRVVFNGGWTHSVTGALPNGTNGYADTKLLGNTDVIKGNFGFGIYSRTNTLTSGAYGVDSSLHIYPRFTDTNSYYRIFNNSTAVINGTSLGLFSGFNDSTNTSYAWFNAVKKQTLASPLTITSANLMLSGNVASTGGYDNRQLAFAFASQYLNDTEVTNLYTRVQAFQTALSRQV